MLQNNHSSIYKTDLLCTTDQKQNLFIKKKSKTFCYSHPFVDSRSFISSKKKIFPQSRNIEPFHARYASIEEPLNSKSLVMSLVKKPYRFTHDTEEENRQSAVGDDRFVRHDTGISNRQKGRSVEKFRIFVQMLIDSSNLVR